MLLELLRDAGLDCTGCSACQIICPQGAIRMQPDEEGFFLPLIDVKKCVSCSLCENTCPQLHPRKDHRGTPSCYAVRADNATLQVSSSGGAFTVLANYVLERDGYVCGAAFDEDFHGASLVMISNVRELDRLRGSKYVYAKPGDIYQQVKEMLEKGNYVLFSGTPCQVAALRNVLGIEYEKLLLVDILCGGVPSEQIFSKYIDEISEGRKVTSVRFRPKEYGWSYSGIETRFEDGSKHMIHSVKDPYLRGFLNWLYVAKACASCQFAPPARQGDFSIGDFWNIDRYSENLKFADGVSCVLVNTDKGERIFEEIGKQFSLVRKVPLSFLKRFNRLQSKRAHHLARPRFFSLIRRGFSIEKAVDYSLAWKFDVALSGCWTVPNYGGELTYYALYCILNDLGYSTIMVERRKDLPNYDVPKADLFRHSPYPFYDVSRIHKNFRDQTELNSRVRNFVLGSDQVWNFGIFDEDAIFSYSFDYVSSYRKKIAYSTSFGTTALSGNEEQSKKLEKVLSTFSNIAVREPTGVDFIKNIFHLKASCVLDPVLCCDTKFYDMLIKNSSAFVSGRYIFTYFVHPNKRKFGIEIIARKMNLGLVNTINASKRVLEKEHFSHKTWKYPYEENCLLEDWLKYIYNSTMVVTDSFHAVCMSIVFKKPFVFIKGFMEEGDGKGRVSTLLERLNIKDRIVFSFQDALKDDKYFQEIDYDSVYKLLERERDRSMQWLKNALAEEKKV